MRELQHELGECKLRVGMLDSALVQKELQLSRLQEQCGSLQTQRDDLKRKLQHLKTQQGKELKEAQKQTSLMLVRVVVNLLIYFNYRNESTEGFHTLG